MSKRIYFDGGGGGIRASATVDAERLPIIEYPGFSHGEANLVSNLSNIVINYANDLGGRIDRAVLAVATLPAEPKDFEAIASKVFSATQISELWICSDSVSSAAAQLSGDGVVIASGTGITAFALGRNQSIAHTIAGDGYLIADVGSGYWIGKMGLAAATKSFDGRDDSEGAKALLNSACETFSTEPALLPHIVHQLDRPVLAISKFAKQVSKLAEDGNLIAQAIIEEAVNEIISIALTAKKICNGDTNFQVALIGGVLSSESLINNIATEKLSKLGLKVETSEKSPLDGAEILANSKEPGVYAKYIKVYHSRNL